MPLKWGFGGVFGHLLGLIVAVSLTLEPAIVITQVNAWRHNNSISVPNPSCSKGSEMGILCRGDAADNPVGGISITLDPNLYEPRRSIGQVFLDKPVKMLDRKSKQVASFNTTFTFNITEATLDENQTRGGDGLSFVMFGNQMYKGYIGGEFAVYSSSGMQGTPTFSVEYDTFQNINEQGVFFNDPNGNHVGVDLDVVASKISRDAGQVGVILNGSHPITTWIEYDAQRQHLEVRIANVSYSRLVNPFIMCNLDLSTVFAENTYVGISAANGDTFEYNNLLSWNFSSSELPDAPSPRRRKVVIAVAIAAMAVALALLVSCMKFWWVFIRKARKRAPDQGFESRLPLEDVPFKFTFKQLSVATNGFSEESRLGEGGSCSVYKGVILSTGLPIAVKKMNVTSDRTAGDLSELEKLFVSEISVISQLRHRNLVKLLGWCRDGGQCLLVYELMPNGSLDHILFKNYKGDEVSRSLLTWSRRSAIVKGVAAGLAYLHEGCVQKIIHRDIKSSNVMLDEEFNAKVGDFGLARLIDHNKILETMQVAGTLGYMAPEMFYGVTTEKTDVFAFGTMALEIACGRPTIVSGVPAEESRLMDWVWKCHGDGDVLNAADPHPMTAPRDIDEIEKILLTGLLCCHPTAEERPLMRDVQLLLEGRMPMPWVPTVRPRVRDAFDVEQIGETTEDLTG